jgi:hypothetical protein
MKAHFETVQTKGNRSYPSLLARCFIPVVSLQNYFQKYYTCGDPLKLFSKTVTCGDLSNRL